MRRWWPVLTLAACGRVGFEPAPDGPLNVDDAGKSIYAQVVEADHPAAYWRFDEPGGATIVDRIGGLTANVEGTGFSRVPGAVNDGDTALQFDGSTSRVEIGDVFGFAGTAPYTIEVWARRPVADDKVRWLIERRSSSTPSDGWELYTGSDFTLHSRIAAGTEQGYATTDQFVPEVWRHIVVTFDGTDTALYIDGNHVGGMLAQPIGGGAGMLVFGDLVAGQFYKFDGVLDELALYDHAVAVDRIRAHHTASGR